MNNDSEIDTTTTVIKLKGKFTRHKPVKFDGKKKSQGNSGGVGKRARRRKRHITPMLKPSQEHALRMEGIFGDKPKIRDLKSLKTSRATAEEYAKENS